MHRPHRFAKRFVRLGTRNGFECNPRPRGELLIGQKRCQRRNGLARSVDGQILAGVGFFRLGLLGMQDGNQIRLFFWRGSTSPLDLPRPGCGGTAHKYRQNDAPNRLPQVFHD